MSPAADKETLADLADRIFDAAQTLRALPDKERGFLRSGERAHWPQIVLSYWEAYGMHGARLRLPAPSARKITQMEETLGWLAWLGGIDRMTMKCVWTCCGENYAPSQAGAILGLHRNMVRSHRDQGLRMIAEKFGLRAAA